MKFGLFYEHQIARPWGEGDEHRLFKDALDQAAPRKAWGSVRRADARPTSGPIGRRVPGVEVRRAQA